MPVIRTIGYEEEEHAGAMVNEAVNSIAVRMTYEETDALKERRCFVEEERLRLLELAIREKTTHIKDGHKTMKIGLAEAASRERSSFDVLMQLLPVSSREGGGSSEVDALTALLAKHGRGCTSLESSSSSEAGWEAFMDMERGADELGRFLAFCAAWDIGEHGPKWCRSSRDALMRFIEIGAQDDDRGSLITFVTDVLRALSRYRRSMRDHANLKEYALAPVGGSPRGLGDAWATYGLVERMKDARDTELNRTNIELPWNCLTWICDAPQETWRSDATKGSVEDTLRKGVPFPLTDNERFSEGERDTMCVWKDVEIRSVEPWGAYGLRQFNVDFAVLTCAGELTLIKCANGSADVRDRDANDRMKELRDMLRGECAFSGEGMRLVCGGWSHGEFDRMETLPLAWEQNRWRGENVDVMWVTPNMHALPEKVTPDDVMRMRKIELLRSHGRVDGDLERQVMKELVRNMDVGLGFTYNGLVLDNTPHPSPGDLLTDGTRRSLDSALRHKSRLAMGKMAVLIGFGKLRSSEAVTDITREEMRFWSWRTVVLEMDPLACAR